MSNNVKAKDIDVVILCGGRGERLQSVVNDRPKILAEINGRPFLDILIDYVANFGFKRFILCIGYMGDAIKRHFTVDYPRKSAFKTIRVNPRYIFSEEKKPLGTAGAIKNAQPFIKSNPFLVINGDSICQLNLNEFIDFHISKKSSFSIVLVKTKRNDDYGVVKLGPSQEVIRFDEKTKARRNDLINTGIYLFEGGLFSLIPVNKNFSLEYDLFPRIINHRFYGYVIEEELIDIGTPERYKKAKDILHTNNFLYPK
jgi:NDP-sugar pyrophosphorylase family protein